MTENIVADSTAKYITSNRDHLRLALMVEGAMPSVREKLIHSVITDVHSSLTAVFPSSSSWEFRRSPDQKLMEKWAYLTVRKQGWAAAADDNVAGITLGTDAANWKAVYLSVSYPAERSSELSSTLDALKTAITTTLRVSVTSHPHWGAPAWFWLDKHLCDWSSESFLLNIVEGDDRERIVKQLTASIVSLIEVVEPILDNVSQ